MCIGNQNLMIMMRNLPVRQSKCELKGRKFEQSCVSNQPLVLAYILSIVGYWITSWIPHC